MKEEYRGKLRKFLAHFDKDIDEVTDKDVIYISDIMSELIKSRDIEVLCGLLGVLTKKTHGCGMLDEGLAQGIFDYYTDKQIAEALFEKFDAIYDNDDDRPGCGLAYILEDVCTDLWCWPKEKESFQIFREMFNTIRPRHAERFLNEMEKYKVEEEKLMIDTLREDMAKW
jgi:hypothetical protein